MELLKELFDLSEDLVDNVLEPLSKAYRKLSSMPSYSSEAKQSFKKIYNDLRGPLMKDDIDAFKKEYEKSLAEYPDHAEELFTAMFVYAGLKHTATIEDFWKKVSES
jgi:hypothetical protein